MAEIIYRLIQEKGQYLIQTDSGEKRGNLTAEMIRLAAQTGRFFQDSKKVVLDPYTKLNLIFEITQKDVEVFVVKGLLRGPTQTLSLSRYQMIFPGKPPCVLFGQLLQNLSQDINLRFLRLVFPDPYICTKKELALLLQDLKEEGEDAPEYFFSTETKGVFSDLLLAAQEEIRPILKLKDRCGAFADLWIDYSQHGEVAFHDERKNVWRKREEERYWEKDLLETDFLKQIVDSSHYYCPMDKVVKSLTFLLEMGWKIIDFQGREVVKQGETKVEVGNGTGVFVLKGHVSYGDHKADVKNIAGAFNRRQRFIELSTSQVGLLDGESSLLAELGEDSLIGEEGVLLAKQNVGLQSGLLSRSIPICEEITSLIHKLTGANLSSHPTSPSDSFQGTLYPYQQEGMNWLYALYENQLGALLADEMGLGKTVQVIALLSRITAVPILIIAPTTLLFHWRKECERFLPHLSVYTHTGDARVTTSEELKTKKVIITSYALARIDHALFYELFFAAIVLDEAQVIKNPLSQIAEVVGRLRSSFRLAITGTPIENQLQDLFSLFHFLLPGLLGDRASFQAKVSTQNDPRSLLRMRQLIKPFILRRRKDLVATQLPAKIEQVIWVEMEERQRDIYEQKIRGYKQGWIKKIQEDGLAAHRMEVLEAILRLRQICCHPQLADPSLSYSPQDSTKLQKLIEDVEAIMVEGRKALIYSQFTSMLSIIEREVKARGWGYVVLDGSTRNREKIVQQFQEDPAISLFLLSLKAGGVGLNLTAADYVLLYDPWWNSAVEMQAIDRVHRLGRSGQVVARRYVVALSIEEKIMKIKEHKSTLVHQLLESESDPFSWKMEELLELIEV